MTLARAAAITTQDHALVMMLRGFETQLAGFVVRMDYDALTVLTNDYWREQVGGLAMNSFLLAASFDPARFSEAQEIEKNVLLLRVVGSAPLPQDGDKLRTLVEHHQRHVQVSRPDSLDGIEVITHSQMQYSGLSCHILGTFYVDARGHLELGSDVEDFQSASQLRVYKPRVEVLEQIVNFVSQDRKQRAREEASKTGFVGEPVPLHLGHVRFSSSKRLLTLHGYDRAKKFIDPLDFFARRTGVFGMTRTGKSNTVKTTVAAVSLAAIQNRLKVGQIIFDLNGEYANANGQDDGSSIAEVFENNTLRYRGVITPGFFDLRDNFYRSLESGLGTIHSALGNLSNLGQDMVGLQSLSFAAPVRAEDHSAVRRRAKTEAIYRALLRAGGFLANRQDDRVQFEAGAAVLAQIYSAVVAETDAVSPKPSNQAARAARMTTLHGNPGTGLTLDQARSFFAVARQAQLALAKGSADNVGLRSSSKNAWFDATDLSMLNLMVARDDSDRRIRGARFLYNLVKDYHAPNGSDNIAKDIFEHLLEGRIVILDLSVGLPSIREDRAKQIAAYIFGECQRLFNNNPKQPPRTVLYIEEAHNLISEKAEPNEVWPRIAKEGAKAGIALVYATQEPSSISRNVLANTENMFVTHLNNDDELRTLAKYYDFGDFCDSLKKAQDVGFARVKTLSTPFVVPVQIAKFEPERLKSEYAAKLPAGFVPAPRAPELVQAGEVMEEDYDDEEEDEEPTPDPTAEGEA